MWWRSRPADVIPCPGCKRMDRFVLVAQFHSMNTKLVARVESVRLACEACKGMWDVSRAGAAVEVKPAREERSEQPPDTRQREKDGEPPDTDLRGLFRRERMPRR